MSNRLTMSDSMKLPPIKPDDSEQDFMQKLISFINTELANSDGNDPDQKYIVHQAAFNILTSHLISYQSLLTAIKKEYEDFIGSLREGKRAIPQLQNKISALSSQPLTLNNYRMRKDQLLEKIAIIEWDNEQLQNNLDMIQKDRLLKEQNLREKYSQISAAKIKMLDTRRIPGFSLQEATDLTVLKSKLHKLERQLKEMKVSAKTRYLPKSRQVELKWNLDEKCNYRDQLIKESKLLYTKRQLLNVSIEAAHAYNRIKPPHWTVGDVIVHALKLAHEFQCFDKDNIFDELSSSSPGDSFSTGMDATAKEQESEMMLDYIEKFNELFESGKLEKAAIHAAISPKGILCTLATLLKFQNLNIPKSVKQPILLKFCSTLMSTVKPFDKELPQDLSEKCVECIIEENRLDLIAHWLSKNKLTLTPLTANMIKSKCICKQICNCGCQSMAESIFDKLGMYKEVVPCLLKQNRIEAALHIASCQADFTFKNYTSVLHSCPSLTLALKLVMPKIQNDNRNYQGILPLGCVLYILYTDGHIECIVHLLNLLQNCKDQRNCCVFSELVLSDVTTSAKEWTAIEQALEERSYNELAVSLFATVFCATIIKESAAFVIC